jgi:outer membrane protein TolC
MKSELYKKITAIILTAFVFTGIKAQTNNTETGLNTADSVDLESVVTEVLKTHPSVIKATEAIQYAEAGIGMAKSARLPDIDFLAGYTHLGPIPSITIPDLGTLKMGINDNINSAVSVRENIYSFTKTEKNIQVQESAREIATASVDLVKEKLTLITALNYYTLVYLQEALVIRNLQIKTLQEYYNFVNKKQETGSATKYEVLSTKVRLSAAENARVDIETAYKNTLTVLNTLLGLPPNTAIKAKKLFIEPIVTENTEKMVDFAWNNRTEMTLAKLRQQNAVLNLSAVKVQNNPVLSAFTNGGFKNGYIPQLQQIKANYAAGLTLKVPIFTASRQKYSELIATTGINLAQQDQVQTERDISAEVYQNDANLHAALQKIVQTELQVQEAEEANKLAELSYKTGSITNLDLLNSQTIEAESRLNLLKAKSDYAMSIVKLKLSLGQKPF